MKDKILHEQKQYVRHAFFYKQHFFQLTTSVLRNYFVNWASNVA